MQGNKKIYDLKSLNFLRNISIAKAALINENLATYNNQVYKRGNYTNQYCNPMNNSDIQSFDSTNSGTKSLKIGVLGGSFNPAHYGHFNISMQALKFFSFDYILWMVAKQNPMKSKYQNDINIRASYALDIAQDKRILVSTAEQDFNTVYAYDTMKKLITHFPNIEFTWLIGIDNLDNFNKWHRYDEFIKLCKFIIFDRDCRNRLANNSLFMSKYEPVVDNSQTHNIITFRGKVCGLSSSSIRGNY